MLCTSCNLIRRGLNALSLQAALFTVLSATLLQRVPLCASERAASRCEYLTGPRTSKRWYHRLWYTTKMSVPVRLFNNPWHVRRSISHQVSKVRLISCSSAEMAKTVRANLSDKITFFQSRYLARAPSISLHRRRLGNVTSLASAAAAPIARYPEPWWRSRPARSLGFIPRASDQIMALIGACRSRSADFIFSLRFFSYNNGV